MCFQVVFFTNSGTEANELALMMARLYTGCHDIISLRNGYHGNAAATMGATAQCNYKFNVVQVYFLPHFFVRSLQILCMCKEYLCHCVRMNILSLLHGKPTSRHPRH